MDVEKNQVFCDSRMIANKFKKKHVHIIKNIKQLIVDFIENETKVSPLVKAREGEYRGQRYAYYEMDRQFYFHLAMRLRGEKAFKWQCKTIDAFFEMEQTLLNQTSSSEWKRECEQAKWAKNISKDEIKTFIEYIVNQGGKQDHIKTTTKQYQALRLIEENEEIDEQFRKILDTMDLYALLLSEQIARDAFLTGINQNLHYKDIYQLAKQRVLQLASIVGIKD